MELSVKVSSSVADAENVEITSVTSVPKEDSGDKELLHERQTSECRITAGTPELTVGGQTPLLRAAAHPFGGTEESDAVREKGDVHLPLTVDLCQDQVSMCRKTTDTLNDLPSSYLHF